MLQKYYNGINFLLHLLYFIVFLQELLYNEISKNILSNYKEEYRYGNESNAKKSK